MIAISQPLYLYALPSQFTERPFHGDRLKKKLEPQNRTIGLQCIAVQKTAVQFSIVLCRRQTA